MTEQFQVFSLTSYGSKKKIGEYANLKEAKDVADENILKGEWISAMRVESLEGKILYSLGWNLNSDGEGFPEEDTWLFQ